MRVRTEIKISRELMEEMNENKRAYRDVINELVYGMLKEIPVEKLKEMIHFEIIDPRSEESEKKINDPTVSNEERNELYNLKELRLLKLKGWMTIPD